jgi:hypothetical protein
LRQLLLSVAAAVDTAAAVAAVAAVDIAVVVAAGGTAAVDKWESVAAVEAFPTFVTTSLNH